MRSSVIAALVAASSVVAQTPHFDVITSPAQGETLKAGSSFEIVWSPSADHPGPITITLIEGPAFNLLNKGAVVAAGIDGAAGKFLWNPVPGANFKANGFNLTLDSDPSIYQLSNGFYISGETTHDSGSTTTSVVGYPTTSIPAYSTSVVGYPTTSVEGYPTTSVIEYSTTAPAATYSAITTSTEVISAYPTTSVAPTTSAYWTTSVIVPPVYQNSTGYATSSPCPTGTGSYTTSQAPSGTGSVVPPTTSGPIVNGASGNVATGAVALFASLLLAFAM